jgi:probable addiction module antidote protein
MTIKKHRNFEETLDETLKNPEKALAYLNAALMDKDDSVFLLALKDVLRAQGIDIKSFAEISNLNRTNIYRILSPSGNPRWNNLKSIINTMGMNITLSAGRK